MKCKFLVSLFLTAVNLGRWYLDKNLPYFLLQLEVRIHFLPRSKIISLATFGVQNIESSNPRTLTFTTSKNSEFSSWELGFQYLLLIIKFNVKFWEFRLIFLTKIRRQNWCFQGIKDSLFKPRTPIFNIRKKIPISILES